MLKEDYVLALQALTEYSKQTKDVKKLREKISIFIERANLDENYNKSMQELADRYQKIENPEDANDNN